MNLQVPRECSSTARLRYIGGEKTNKLVGKCENEINFKLAFAMK